MTWGLGAFIGALAVGTFLSRIDRRHLVSIGFATFAVSLGAFALVRSAGPAFPIALALGFTYFMTATSLSTIFQQNLADTERAAVMPLWFMAFGGTVPIGNLIVRTGHRCDRRTVGAAVRRRVRGVPRLVGRPAPAVSRRLPPRGAGRHTVPARQPGSPSRVPRPAADSAPRMATGSSAGATPYSSVPTATSSMPSRRASGRHLRVRGLGIVELGHHPEDRDAPIGGQRGERLERGAHRRRVGVVGVVDHDRARRIRRVSIRIAEIDVVASAAAAAASGTPSAPATASAAAALSAMWRPLTARRHVGAVPHGVHA